MSDELLALAREVGLEAADFVASSRPDGRVGVADTKSSPTDVVTEIDHATEDLIRSRILERRPDDGFVGEEGHDVQGTSPVEWVVDPIDGTVNFVYGIPCYAVSIAAAVDGVVEAGYVVNVASGEEWAAVRGAGSWRQVGERRVRLTAPEPPVLAHALVGTGFSYVPEIRAKQAAALAQLLPQVRDIRRTGSAALDLCELAAGRLDAFVEQGLMPWDHAAAGLVATEAGILVAGLDGEPDERLVMAAHPAISEEYFALFRACGF
ncbi:inositol monophosphatase family protein [Aeromicrobium sp.]|uniref:inositol monophosphatase family protein n=1 Tax=Aeromicrobium sp. TaxID=1871063 RepID=UPI003D6B56EF